MVQAGSIVAIILFSFTPIFFGIGATIFLCYFQSEADKKRAWLAKILVIFTLTLSALSLILIPIDLTNRRIEQIGEPFVATPTLDFALGIIFQCFYGFVILFLFLVLPFAIVYYETEDHDRPFWWPLMWGGIVTSILCVVAFIILMVLFFTIGHANIPVQKHVTAVYSSSLEQAMVYQCESRAVCPQGGQTYQFKVQFVVYMIGLVNTIGWVVFLVLGGFGITTLPLECIKAFVKRPKRIRADDYHALRVKIQEKTEKMIELGERIQDGQDHGTLKGAKYRQLMKDFKASTLQIEEEWDVINKSFYLGGGSVILPILKLIGGILLFPISLIWLLHIFSWLVLPIATPGIQFGFLNYVLKYSDFLSDQVPFIGSFLYAFFSIYWIFCIIAAATRISELIPIFVVHQMIPHKTTMNSLLFNSGLILLSSLTVTQFVADAFSQYISTSSLDVMYRSVIKNLFILEYFYRYFVNYAILVFAALGFVASCIAIFIPRWKTKNEISRR
eukprot:gene2692-3888_t